MWGCVGLAMICLLGLLFGDSGEIQRSPEICFPLPPEVAQRLASGETLDGLANITDEERGIYCVRCFVWRPRYGAHHCRLCQRCTVDFDHHCGVFGRCIAGKGLSGNMKYFVGIIMAAVLGEVGGIVFFLIAVVMNIAES